MTSSDSFESDAAVPDLAIGYWHALPEDPADLTPEEMLTPRTDNAEQLRIKGNPAGGGYSTVEDLLRFDRALQGHRLIGREMTRQVQAGKVETPLEPSIRYAYGFIDDRSGGTRSTVHGGGARGISASLALYVDSGATAAVLANYGQAAETVAAKIRALLAHG